MGLANSQGGLTMDRRSYRADRNIRGETPPSHDSTPNKNTENQQLQWVIESLTQLRTSHETFTNKIDGRLDVLEEKIDRKHTAIIEKVDNHKELLSSKIENSELKMGKSISDSKVDTIKWVLGLPAVGWVVYQILKAINYVP